MGRVRRKEEEGKVREGGSEKGERGGMEDTVRIGTNVDAQVQRGSWVEIQRCWRAAGGDWP